MTITIKAAANMHKEYCVPNIYISDGIPKRDIPERLLKNQQAINFAQKKRLKRIYLAIKEIATGKVFMVFPPWR